MLKEKEQSILVVMLRRCIHFLLVSILLVSIFVTPMKVHANPYGGGDGNCTYTAWRLAYENTGIQLPAWGHAYTWYDSARNAGYTVSAVPRAKSIAVWSGGDGGLGHVAYVSQVNGDQIYIHEGGYVGSGYHEGWENAYGQTKYYHLNFLTMTGYIYLEDSASNNPEGCLDSVEGVAGGVKVDGWGFDRDNLSESIEIHVYIGGSASPNVECHGILANTSRTDVNQVYACGDNHGFSSIIPTTKTGQQEVWVYAINIGNGDNVCLGSQTVNIYHNPEGSLDSVEEVTGGIKISGWSFDRDSLSESIKIHVYIGGSAAPDVECHEILADKGRKDVDQVHLCGENHGFDEVIMTDKIGEQEVYVYALNVGNGDNVFLGNRTINLISQPGDVYQDGKIDGKDVSLLLQYRLKKRELTEEQIAAGDVYADGKIDGKDVSKLLQYRLGKIDSLE